MIETLQWLVCPWTCSCFFHSCYCYYYCCCRYCCGLSIVLWCLSDSVIFHVTIVVLWTGVVVVVIYCFCLFLLLQCNNSNVTWQISRICAHLIYLYNYIAHQTVCANNQQWNFPSSHRFDTHADLAKTTSMSVTLTSQALKVPGGNSR